MSKLIVFATVSVGVFAFVVIYLANPAYASSSISRNDSGQIIQELNGSREKNIANFINTRITNYKDNLDINIINPQKINVKIQNILSSYREKNLDVTKLNSDSIELKSMLNSFSSGYKLFMGLLKEVGNLGSIENNLSYRSKINQSKIELNKTRLEAIQIQNFINTVIKNDIKDLNA